MKKILAAILVAVQCFALGAAVQADGVDGPAKPEVQYADGFYYVVTDEAAKEAQITGCNENVLTGPELVIPETIGEYRVTSFGREAFAYTHFTACDLSAAPILSENMFYGSALKTVKFSEETTEIPDSCFTGGCKLYNLSLPEGLRHIGEFAFSGIEAKEIVLPSTIESFGMLAFKDCARLETLVFQAPKGEGGLRLLGEDGTLPIFEAGNLKTLVLPETVTYIAPGEFSKVVYTAHGTFVYAADTSNLTIYAPAGSYAEQYAKEYGIEFSVMDEPYEKEAEVPKVKIYTSLPNNGNLRSAMVDLTEDSTPDFRYGGASYRGNGGGTYNVTVTLKPTGERKFTSEEQVMEEVLIDGNPPIAVTLSEDGGAEVTGFCYNGSGKHADQLYRLGLAKGIGTGEDGRPMFDLAAGATRAEAVAMLVRLRGYEEQAQGYGKTHPFTDVPAWADGYISLAYDHGWANGVSDTLFDAGSPVSREMFLAFMLRALWYSDNEEIGKEFEWDNPYALAKSAGIWEYAYDDESFLRMEMFDIAFSALFAHTRGRGQLYEQLITFGVFTPEEWEAAIYERGDADTAYTQLRSRTTSEIGLFRNAYFADRGPFFGTVLQGTSFGRPAGGKLCLVYNENMHMPESGEKRIFLPLPQVDLEGNLAEPENCGFSADWAKFHYSCTFAEPLTDGETVLREAGTYAYTTDIASGETTFEILPLS